MDTEHNVPRTDAGEGDLHLSNYEIAPEDQALADEITSRDPLEATRGPVSVQADPGTLARLPTDLPLSALDPATANAIRAEVSKVSPAERPALEAKLIGEAVRALRLQLRVSAGPGEGTDPYWREAFAIANERQQLEQEVWRLEAELAEVERFDTIVDPATGQTMPKAVERYQGELRRGMELRRDELLRQLKVLTEIESPRRLQKARFEAVQLVKAQRQQLADEAEVRRRAEEKVREERIERRAEARAKMLRGSGY